MNILYIGNDMLLQLSGDGKLTDEDGTAVTGATVEATVYKADGETEVSGITWPLTLTEGDDGEYSATIQDDIEVTEGQNYVIKITATKGNADAKWFLNAIARKRS